MIHIRYQYTSMCMSLFNCE